MKNKNGITLIALIITIIIMLILAGIAINLGLGENGLLNKAEEAKETTIKEAATEKINLKITNMQIQTYADEQRMPTLQEFADGLCEDNEIQYVELQSKKVATLDKIEVGNATSIFTKLKEYPYEFEINSSLQLASVDGIKVETTNTFTGEIVHFRSSGKGITNTSGNGILTDTYTFEEGGTYIIIASMFMGGENYNPPATMTFKINGTQLEETVVTTHVSYLIHYYKFTANKGDVLSANITSKNTTNRVVENYLILK